MECKITKYSSLDSLEFGLLEELPKLRILNSLVSDEEKEDREKFFEEIVLTLKKVINQDYIFEAVEKREDGFICVCSAWQHPFVFVQEYSNIEVGEVYFYLTTNYGECEHIIKVNKELIDEEKTKGFFKEMDEWVQEAGQEKDNYGRYPRSYEGDNLVKVGDIEDGEINFKVIMEKFEEHKKETEEREKQEKEKAEEEEKEKEVEENNEKEIYETKGEGSFGGIFHVTGKIIKDSSNSNEYILDKDVNKIFSYDEIIRMSCGFYSDRILTQIESFLVDKKKSYTKKMVGGKGYKVTYIDGKCKIDKVNIPKVKINFVLNRIHHRGGSKDEIKILVKLNGMKADFIDLEEIQLSNLDYMKVPITNNVINDKTFEVEFCGRKKVFDWDEVKDWFYRGGGSRSVTERFDNRDILKLSEEMGISKKELFMSLKRVKILNSLNNEDDN